MQTFTQFPLKSVPGLVTFSGAWNLREENSGLSAKNTLKIELIFTA
jgi:hypothetical protein